MALYFFEKKDCTEVQSFCVCSAPVGLVEGGEDGGKVAILDAAVGHHAAGGVVIQHGFADEREFQGLTDPEAADVVLFHSAPPWDVLLRTLYHVVY